MGYQVTNQRTALSFSVAAGETILDAGLRTQRVFPYGCRGGACGACKSDLISGRVDYGKYDAETLTAEDIAAGKVLLCQAVPLTDVVIDASESAADENIQIKKLPCRVMKLNRLAKDVMQVFLQLPKSQEFNFQAGQYVDILLKDGARRSFSIANLPNQISQDGLELHIRKVAGGHFSPRVFNHIRARDLLRLEGPFGNYILQTEATRRMIMVAGGTGFSPIKGLIMQALKNNPMQWIHLFWGARDQQDLYMHSEVENWANQYENFSYTPVLSDADAADWPGARGFVHSAAVAKYASFAGVDVYASGPPVMVEAVQNSFSEKGMDATKFFFDSFTYAEQG